MTTKRSGASKTPNIVPSDTMDSLVGGNGENMATVLQYNSALMSGMSAYGEEVMAFANRRLSANMKQSDALLCCQDMEEALRLNCEFARTATEQYFEQADRLVRLAAQISQGCWLPLERQGRKALHELSGASTTSA